MKKREKHGVTSKKKWIILILIIVCLIGLAYSSYRIISWKIHTDANDKIQEELSSSIKVINSESGTDYVVDFETLKGINSDTVAYVKVNNTNIDHVVVKGPDNSYYLNHNFKKEWNYGGWIFADYRNKFDGTDKNIVIYGHNIKNGSMFETLKYTITEEWYKNEENQRVVLVTESGTHLYKVFSTYSTVSEDYYISTSFNDDASFDDFVKTLKKRSVYDYGVEVSGQDQILTLSSCLDGRENRIVLHAKLIQDEEDI